MAVQPAGDPLRRYLRVQRVYDAKLARVLERAALDIRARINRLSVKPGVGAAVRTAQLRLVLDEIRDIQREMWATKVPGVILEGQRAAALAAEDAAAFLDRVLGVALPDDVAEAVRDGLRATARAGIDADFNRVPRELSARVYDNFALSRGHVEQTIRSGLVSGLSARELASDVYKFISPSTPGGASYAASRLARTEINNAFHQQQIKGAERPGVLAVKWNLSGSHPRPDKCNQYADGDHDGLGHGYYKPGNVPGKPHPNCLCYLTYKTMNAREFADALERGQFDDELDRRIKENLRILGFKK